MFSRICRQLTGLRSDPTIFCKRFLRCDYEKEVSEIFDIVAKEYYHTLKAQQLADIDLQKEMLLFQQKTLIQQQAMLESLQQDNTEILTARTYED